MDYLVDGGVVMAVTMGIVQIFKGLIPSRYVPLLAVLVGGVVGTASAYAQSGDLVQGAVAGAVAGLTAAGTYDTVAGLSVSRSVGA